MADGWLLSVLDRVTLTLPPVPPAPPSPPMATPTKAPTDPDEPPLPPPPPMDWARMPIASSPDVVMIPSFTIVTVEPLPPPLPLPPTETIPPDEPPSPPPPPMDCAIIPRAPFPPVTMRPRLVTLTAAPVPPLDPVPPIATRPYEFAPVPPLPPMDWA
ncbi:hypothetical protein RA27_01670, partial [Ruegeria sp. ANG-R]